MSSSRIGFGLVDEQPEHALAPGRSPDRTRVGFVDAFVDEFDQLVVVSADAERPVVGVDEFAWRCARWCAGWRRDPGRR